MGILSPENISPFVISCDLSDDENDEYIVEVDEPEMNSMNTIPHVGARSSST